MDYSNFLDIYNQTKTKKKKKKFLLCIKARLSLQVTKSIKLLWHMKQRTVSSYFKYIYIYIYIERERDRQTETERQTDRETENDREGDEKAVEI